MANAPATARTRCSARYQRAPTLSKAARPAGPGKDWLAGPRSGDVGFGSGVGGHGTAGRGPVLHAARHVDRLPAGRGQRVRSPPGAHAGPADYVDGLILRNLRGAGTE